MLIKKHLTTVLILATLCVSCQPPQQGDEYGFNEIDFSYANIASTEKLETNIIFKEDLSHLELEEDVLELPETNIFCENEINDEVLSLFSCQNNKVVLCHFPNGDENKGHLISLDKSLLSAHLNQAQNQYVQKDFLVDCRSIESDFFSLLDKKFDCSAVCSEE